MRYLTPRQVKVLEDDGWYVMCESPWELEKDNGFNPCSRITDPEEAIKMAQAIIHSNNLRKTLLRKEKDVDTAKKEKALVDIKKVVIKLIDQGITVDNLFEFYLLSNNFGHRFNPSSKCLKDCFTEVIEGK
jgi:hypothetical protein